FHPGVLGGAQRRTGPGERVEHKARARGLDRSGRDAEWEGCRVVGLLLRDIPDVADPASALRFEPPVLLRHDVDAFVGGDVGGRVEVHATGAAPDNLLAEVVAAE